jgi:hypothetical protein
MFYILKHIVNKILYFSKVCYYKRFQDHLTMSVVLSQIICSYVRHVAVNVGS